MVFKITTELQGVFSAKLKTQNSMTQNSMTQNSITIEEQGPRDGWQVEKQYESPQTVWIHPEHEYP